MVTKNRHAKKTNAGASQRRRKPRAPYVWEQLLALAETIPPEERKKAPRDGARNTHHYLYGSPKRD